MVDFPGEKLDRNWIERHRGRRNPVDPFKPYALYREKERSWKGNVIESGTIFLTGWYQRP